jgi:hypothetical protein
MVPLLFYAILCAIIYLSFFEGVNMSNDVVIEQIRAAREITVALIDKALIPFTEEELMQPRKLAMKIGSVYAGVHDAVKNPGAYLKG